MEIQVKNLDHLGIVAGIVDQIGLVEEIDRQIGKHPQQLIIESEKRRNSDLKQLEK